MALLKYIALHHRIVDFHSLLSRVGFQVSYTLS
jgi:hypothetical protein